MLRVVVLVSSCLSAIPAECRVVVVSLTLKILDRFASCLIVLWVTVLFPEVVNLGIDGVFGTNGFCNVWLLVRDLAWSCHCLADGLCTFWCWYCVCNWSHFLIRAEGTPGMAGFILVFAGMCWSTYMHSYINYIFTQIYRSIELIFPSKVKIKLIEKY